MEKQQWIFSATFTPNGLDENKLAIRWRLANAIFCLNNGNFTGRYRTTGNGALKGQMGQYKDSAFAHHFGKLSAGLRYGDKRQQAGSRDENYDYVHFRRGQLLEKMGKAFALFWGLPLRKIRTGRPRWRTQGNSVKIREHEKANAPTPLKQASN